MKNRIIRKYAISVYLLLLGAGVWAQSAYFVDGYHGGIYGHYPLWNTQFYVDKLAEHPEWQICLEIEPETWGMAKEKTPEAYRAFQQIAASSRIEFTNPTLAQPYMYNVSGESIIRQLRHGMEMINSHFPDVRFTTYSVEEPCFTSCLPQILKLFGYKYAVLKCPNTCWGGYSAAYGKELVNWVGPDGTSMLTVPRYACEELEDNSVWQTKAWGNSREYLDACRAAGIEHPVGMCFQDAGWKNGPWLGSGDSIKSGSIYQTWKNYIENVTPGQTDDNYHFSQEEILPGLMWGSQVLQKLAQEVRASENNMIQAEKVNAMNFIRSGKQVDDVVIREAWRTLALSQHHDSWIVPYNNLARGKTWAQTITEWTAETNRAAKDIIATSFAPDNACDYDAIRVINTTSKAREEWVELLSPQESQGGASVLRFLAQVPAFGCAIYRIEDIKKTKNHLLDACKAYRANESEFVLESDVYKIVFDLNRGGIITSLIAKKIGDRELVDTTSDFAFGELRGFFYEEGIFRSNTEVKAQIIITEQEPEKVSVEIKGRIAGHVYSNHITLQQGQDRIDCALTIDWDGNPGIGEFKAEDTWALNHRPSYDDRYKLLILFPTSIGEGQVYKNAPFDVCKSRLADTFYSSWDSIKHNVALNWVDFMAKDESFGLALFTDHTTTYTHGANFPPGLTVQYSGKGLWGRDYPITGSTRINYALLPHLDRWDKAGIWTSSLEWNEPLIVQYCVGGAEKGASFVSLDKSGYEITTIEVIENELYLRLFNAESSDETVAVRFGFVPAKVEEVQLNGMVIREMPILDRQFIETSMPRFGLKTFKITL